MTHRPDAKLVDACNEYRRAMWRYAKALDLGQSDLAETIWSTQVLPVAGAFREGFRCGQGMEASCTSR